MSDTTYAGIIANGFILACIIAFTHLSTTFVIIKECESAGYSRIGSTVLVCSVMEGRE